MRTSSAWSRSLHDFRRRIVCVAERFDIWFGELTWEERNGYDTEIWVMIRQQAQYTMLHDNGERKKNLRKSVNFFPFPGPTHCRIFEIIVDPRYESLLSLYHMSSPRLRDSGIQATPASRRYTFRVCWPSVGAHSLCERRKVNNS